MEQCLKVGYRTPVRVFIAYSRFDRKHLWPDAQGNEPEFLRRLRPLEQEEGAELYWDGRLRVGDMWDVKLRQWLAEADILLALVSDDFLHSGYCQKVEVGTVLKRRRKHQEVVIAPFLLSPCEWKRVKWLSDLDILPPHARSMKDIRNTAERTRELIRLRDHLRRLICDCIARRLAP